MISDPQIDPNRLRYEQKKKRRGAKKASVVKLLELRPNTHAHDLETKARTARGFLEAGNGVKVRIRYRGRERTHPEIARAQIDTLTRALADIARIEGAISVDARAMSVLFVPTKKAT